MSLLLLNMWLEKLAEDWTRNVNSYWGEEFFAVCMKFDNLFSSMHIQTGGGNMMCSVVFLKLTGWFFFICSCAPILCKLLTLDTIAWLMMEFTHWKKVSWGTSPYRDLAFQIQDFPVKVGKTINTDCTAHRRVTDAGFLINEICLKVAMTGLPNPDTIKPILCYLWPCHLVLCCCFKAMSLVGI